MVTRDGRNKGPMVDREVKSEMLDKGNKCRDEGMEENKKKGVRGRNKGEGGGRKKGED